jgi:hypothetical protein
VEHAPQLLRVRDGLELDAGQSWFAHGGDALLAALELRT